ncbi:carboxymuconolactone decarboxylase family protein [Pontibacter cellulosilyticus]|uniref:Carboxymuconolactone decarboxylase family protein n=1 Tax=Pontibacter cellulosilyticus TaxID=1720253 RepID=A0A923N562_9BACT|nr:carboxymuconolactone decarboxylase family protein [Pontibacter cellulosilyticus]MBC5992054.1 carboxymuconolactone decarboxylase family protein [Pontibacter cellulosilyticus]
METRVKLSDNGSTPFAKLLGHNPAILQAWDELEVTLFNRSGLDAALLEQVRRTLAFGNQCAYCMAKGKPNEVKADKRESYATAFAELFALDHLSISGAHFELLREVFTEKEIAALCAFICFITASQRFGAILNLQPVK